MTNMGSISIPDQIEKFFPSTIKSRGLTYLNKLTDISYDDFHYSAFAKGSKIYQTSLNREFQGDEEHISGYCSCPFYENHDHCKHLWALIIAAEKSKWLPEAHDDLYAAFGEEPEDVRDIDSSPHTDSSDPLDIFQALINKREPKTQTQKQNPFLVWYSLNLEDTSYGKPYITLFKQRANSNSTKSNLKGFALTQEDLLLMTDSKDRAICSEFLDLQPTSHYSQLEFTSEIRHIAISESKLLDLLPDLLSTGRLVIHEDLFEGKAPKHGLKNWIEAEYAEFFFEEDVNFFQLSFAVKGEDFSIPRQKIEKVFESGFFLTEDRRMGQIKDPLAAKWAFALFQSGGIKATANDLDSVIKSIFTASPIPEAIKLPEVSLWKKDTTVQPKPVLIFDWDKLTQAENSTIPCKICFKYGEVSIFPVNPSVYVSDAMNFKIIRRNATQEGLCIENSPFKDKFYPDLKTLIENISIKRDKFIDALKTLAEKSWDIEADNKSVKVMTSISSSVKSGIDWLDVSLSGDFNGDIFSSSALVQALLGRKNTIKLNDNTLGLIPDQFLDKIKGLLDIGKQDGDAIKLSKSHSLIVDLLLESLGASTYDQIFKKDLEAYKKLKQPKLTETPKGFKATLRPYQLNGLSWMKSLQQSRLGGCLADDMGLGKTIQVLALMHDIYVNNMSIDKDTPPSPSLLVLPRSLITNWMMEAKKFSPKLKVLDYSTPSRKGKKRAFDDHHLILTTYSIMSREILSLKDYEFNYIVLDEAQAIKNKGSLTSRSAKLLSCKHRLALSGTPIENHLGELWSLLEFLNPDLLASSKRKNLLKVTGFDNPNHATLNMISKLADPFILRRTKDQVLTELPKKTEKTIYCELTKEQKREYDQLRDHYLNKLNEDIENEGIEKSQIKIIEALTRLRQAACHPGLIDKTSQAAHSAKTAELLDVLDTIIAEGHKALVFSQFTSFLAIIKQHLENKGIPYIYLDGATRDRQSLVDRFQNDAKLPLFLISIKAGGVGLNLTAADYCFILDPWWNPAIEAQAIDRAHRMGQKKPVMAYRLISKGTVEEKILTLQNKKKALVDSIINESSGSMLKSLSLDDLRFLLS